MKSQKFKPLQRGEAKPLTPEAIEGVAKVAGISPQAALRALESERQHELWINDIYQVQKRDLGQGWFHLNIRRRDGKAIFRDWRHFQAIKNQLCGLEAEAVELYPAESRLVDTSNKYHLWVGPVGFRFPLGFDNRQVTMHGEKYAGVNQRGEL